jgi:outer membrane protein OmpA-like peptidoglycan-associated protein
VRHEFPELFREVQFGPETALLASFSATLYCCRSIRQKSAIRIRNRKGEHPMSQENLLDAFKGLLAQPLADHAAQLLGQPADGIGAGVDQLLPNLLGAIVHRGSNSNEGAAALRDLLNTSSVDTDLLSQNVNEALAGGPQTEALLQLGQTQLDQLYGAKQSNLQEAAANAAGVNAAQGATLTAVATPFALALLKRNVNSASGTISAAQLARFLDAQKKHFGGLSEAFFKTLGLGSLGAWLAVKPTPVAAKPVPPLPSAAASAAAAKASAGKGRKWLLWVLLAALIVALLAWCSQHGSGSADQSAGASAASDASAASSDASAAAVAVPSASTADEGTQAASGVEASAAANTDANASGAGAAAAAAGADMGAASTATGTAAASDADSGNSATAGQSSDRGLPLKVFFSTGKAALGAQFHKQAQVVVEYAKAHPDAKFSVTGYTDARGSVQRNVGLAKRRAEAVAHALAADGVDASRLSIERPASTTEETGGAGQEGRRVDVSVQQ